MTKPVRIIQQELEQKYSRSNIRAKVLTDILDSQGDLADKIANANVGLIDYVNKSYYLAKDKRISEYMANDKACDTMAIVLEILICVMPVEGAQSIQGIVGRIAPLLKFKDFYDGLVTASEMIAVVCFSDLYDIIPARNSETGGLMVKSNYRLEEETMQYIANTQYMPPMVCKPNIIENNRSCGYLTLNESIILGKNNHHAAPQAYDALNQFNEIELSLDERMLAFEEPLKLKKNKDGSELTPEQIADRRVSHMRMVNSSKAVYQLMLDHGNSFYITWKYDKRGRIYCQGYHCNVQGSSYKKAIVNLAKKELITM